jgi:hypothetical protein
MVEWYGQKGGNNIGQVFKLTDYPTPENMLRAFWLSLINGAPGCTVYFHNWSGYDSILSLGALLSLHDSGLKFLPVVRDGRIISLEVSQVLKGKNTRLLIIKDSFKLLPSALAKLAKDFKVGQQKKHFPHYFNPLEQIGSMDYVGPIPAYEFFEPKRTTLEDWEKMAAHYGDTWSFMEVARDYLHSDCVCLHQVLVAFFKELNTQFSLNPIQNLSIPGVAFKAWKQHQLPLLHSDKLQVYDLSKSLDSIFRGAYHGGIVDVYRPHLVGGGYYYDVKSLYPTAMCRPMPVGVPTQVTLTPDQFIQGEFFGYLKAQVEAPVNEYIGLLPIKLNGRLICPVGTFEGFFFSEELRFALVNGYQLLGITEAWAFQRGDNTFKTLIEQLNTIKVEAQLAGKPVLRNIAKLMMNSMYGRFGMHVDEEISAIVSLEALNNLVGTCQVISNIKIGELYLVSYLPRLPLGEQVKGTRKHILPRPMETNVPIAAAVTAYSRMIINGYKLDALNAGLELYYSDTDSLVLNGPLSSHLVDPAEMGMLKLEHEIAEGYFVAPKIYWFQTPDGNIVSKCKGYPGNLTRAQVESLYHGENLNLTVSRWARSLTQQTVEIKVDQPYQIQPIFNKRDKVYDEKGVWVNTRPLILAQ